MNGRNPGRGTAGFFAALGWDPVTGLGKSTVQFKKRNGYIDSTRNSQLHKHRGFLNELAMGCKINLEESGTPEA